MSIIGSDTIAGDAFGVGAFGLADRGYGMQELLASPMRYLAARRTLIWDGVKRLSPNR